MTAKINVKWGKELFKDVEVNLDGTAEDFRLQLFSLSNVPAENQKVMGKGMTLKDENWANFKKVLVPGTTLMMMGTPIEVMESVPTTTTTVFMEDLPEEEQHVVSENLAPGLTNLENTCYMNACVQMMNAVTELGPALDKMGNPSDTEGKVAVALKDLLRQMRNQKTTVTPLLFLAMLRTSFPRFAEKVGGKYRQQSADECWVQMVQCLKRVPKIQVEPAAEGNNGIEQLLQGELLTTTKCIEAPEEQAVQKLDSFDCLHCHIELGVDFLFQGINKGLETSLEKFSPTTQKNAHYSVSSKINRLPYYLVVQFLRFEWKQHVNDGAGGRAKILRPVEFPFELDAHEFASESLKEKLKPKREEVRLRNDKPQAERGPIHQNPLTNETGFYELAAVLTHRGRDADGGHYVCWVRQDGDNWLCFDDDQVSRVGPDDIRKLVGKGGADWHLAYMCLYRTKQFQ